MKKRTANQQRSKRMDLLSKKELRVMKLYGQGYSTIEIADRCHNSPKTVDSHKMRAVLKLRIENSEYRKVAFKLAAGLI